MPQWELAGHWLVDLAPPADLHLVCYQGRESGTGGKKQVLLGKVCCGAMADPGLPRLVYFLSPQ